MATLTFKAGEVGAIQHLSGSGLGFFGSTFGQSVDVAAYQDTTWITNGAGTTQGPQVDNVKWAHPSSGSVNGAAAVNLLDIPNYLSTLEINFTHTSAVKTQNAKFRIYDRSNINNDPSGVTCKVAEIIHPSTTQTGQLGSGDSTWLTPTGSSVIMDMVASPGMSGLRPNGAQTTSDNHSWFAVLSASPTSIGSKTNFGAYFECEYL